MSNPDQHEQHLPADAIPIAFIKQTIEKLEKLYSDPRLSQETKYLGMFRIEVLKTLIDTYIEHKEKASG